MTAYRHAAESLVVRWCMAPGTAAGYCGCTTPTPDPASPCAVCDAKSGDHRDVHPRVPTRCLSCGHALVPA